MASVIAPQRKFSITKRDIPPVLRSPPPRLPTKQYAMRRNRKLTSEEVKSTVTRKGNYQEWSYNGENGPDNWQKHFPVAASDYQSPVNIDRRLVVYDSKLRSLMFDGYSDFRGGAKVNLRNNGCTVMLRLFDEVVLAREDLPDKYQAFHVLFHWGSNNSRGSEHLADGKAYPMEVQIVHRNLKYSEEQMYDKLDGLLILAFWVEVSDINNDGFDYITKNLRKVRFKGQEAEIAQFPLHSILPEDTSIYYTYPGSLTSPPCNECVTWVILGETVHISMNQMNKFREISSSEGDTSEMLADNFRPVQRICRRKVKVCMPLLNEHEYLQQNNS